MLESHANLQKKIKKNKSKAILEALASKIRSIRSKL